MKPCCNGMQSMLARSGSDGFSVRLKDDGGDPFFVIEFRSYPIEKQDYYRDCFKKNSEMPRLITAGEEPIRFCPWCGHDLRVEMAEIQLGRKGLFWVLKKYFGFPVSE